MDVKFVTAVVVLAVMVSQTSETLFSRAFDCCMKISDDIPKGILRKVERFDNQETHGPCHLEAIILHIKGKKFCVNPQNRKVKKMMKKMKQRSQFQAEKNQRENRSSSKMKQDP